MPHVKIGYPHKAKDGTKRVQGETVYVSSAEAKTLVADGKGKIVKPSPEEVVALAKEKEKEKADRKAKSTTMIVGEPGPEIASFKDPVAVKSQPKRPAAQKKDEPTSG